MIEKTLELLLYAWELGTASSGLWYLLNEIADEVVYLFIDVAVCGIVRIVLYACRETRKMMRRRRSGARPLSGVIRRIRRMVERLQKMRHGASSDSDFTGSDNNHNHNA